MSYKLIKLFTFTLFIFFFCGNLNSETISIKKVGHSFVNNYSKELYNAGSQNWDIVQDNKGFMYFANNQGLLQYDGKYWNIYPIPNNSMIRAICIDRKDNIWVGGFNQIGYFTPNSSGKLIFHSAISLIDEKYRDFGDVWKIYSINENLIIQTFDAIFEFDGETFKPLIWKADLHYSFYSNGELFVKVNNSGLHVLRNDSLILVENGKIFSNTIISAVIEKARNEKYIITANQGIYLMSESGINHLDTPINSFLAKNQVFDAIRFQDYFFFGTVQDGMVITDRYLNPIQHINRERGLQNNTILSLFVDAEQNLWLGLDSGIDYIKINSPLSYIIPKDLIGAGYQTIFKDNILYLGTNQGLYYMPWPDKSILFDDNPLTAVKDLQGQVWCLNEIDNTLICGHDKGTFIVNKGNCKNISDIAGSLNMVESPNENLVIMGTYSGIVALENKSFSANYSWSFRNKISGFNDGANKLIKDNDNNYWIGHGYKGIYKVTLDNNFKEVIKSDHFGAQQGLPGEFSLNLLEFEDQIIISCEKGYFSYNKKKNFFYPFNVLNSIFKNEVVTRFINDPTNNNTWFFTKNRMGILKPNFDGSYIIEDIPFMELTGKFISQYESVFFIDNDDIIISTEDGFVHFDPTYKKKYNIDYKTRIKKVTCLSDSILYYGISKNQSRNNQQIAHNFNSMKFRFSASTYSSPQYVKFKYLLEGFDKDWSEWSEQTEKEYTNLTSGNYTFKVKSVNSFGFEGEPDSWSFTILPPWYKTWYAYLLYLFFMLFLIYLLIRWLVNRFEKEKKLLEEKQYREMQEKQKEFERQSLRTEQEIIKLRNEKLMLDNQRKQAELVNKTKELASIAMQTSYKNQMLNQIRQKLTKVSQDMIHIGSKKQIEGLIKTLDKDMVRDDEWEIFELSFDQVHEDFLRKLRNNYSELSPKDLRLSAYLRMNLSSKEIAPLLNISTRGVEISRYRLRKKLDLDRDVNLTDFLMKL